MTDQVARSYACCTAIARRAASNFYLSFYLLPRQQRQAMCALYAFLRRTDDVGDSPDPVAARRSALCGWRSALEAALAGRFDDPLMPALMDTVARYRIPPRHLFEVIDGVQMDLTIGRYATFAELEHYCHHVASAVGLACIRIWGFHSDEALPAARACGVAFQLTNILRDLGEDAARGRIYLPEEDLERFGYRADELMAGMRDDRFRRLIEFEVDRAESCYRQAAALQQWLSPSGRRVFGAMFTTYERLLHEIARREGDVFTRRIRLSRWQRWGIATRWLLTRPVLKGGLAPDRAADATPANGHRPK